MKILQVAGHFPPSLGGIQFFVQRLSQAFANRGHQVDVLTINTVHAPDEEISPEGIRIYRCNLDFSYHRGVISTQFFKRLMSANGYDILHVHIPFPFGLEAAVIASKRNHIPVIATHHGQGIKGSPIYTLIAGTYSLFSRAISMQGLNSLLFLTESYSQSLWLPKSVGSRIHIVPTGSDIQAFSPINGGSEIRSQYGIKENTPLLLFVGHLGLSNRYKGVDILIRAMAIVRARISEAKLIVVGGGDWLDELKSLVRSLNLEKAVLFVGPIENKNLPGYYAAADCFVLPSIHGPENSPVVVFEAMASSIPVIASNLPGVRDIVRHGETGLLVPPNNVNALSEALINVLLDADFRQSAGHKGRQLAESYTWDACSQEIESIYSSCLN